MGLIINLGNFTWAEYFFGQQLQYITKTTENQEVLHTINNC